MYIKDYTKAQSIFTERYFQPAYYILIGSKRDSKEMK